MWSLEDKMKGKKKKQSGISLETVQTGIGKEKGWEIGAAYVFDLVLFLILMFCMIGCFINGYEIACNKKLLYGVSMLAGVLFFITFSLKKWGEVSMVLMLLAYGGCSIYFRDRIAAGLAVVMNKVIEKAANYYHFAPWKYEETSGNEMLNATLLILFVFILIIGMEAYLYVKKFNFYLTLLIPILFVFSPEIIGIVPSAFYFVTFILVALACIGSETRQQSKKNKNPYVWKARGIQLLIGFLALALFLVLFPKEEYEEATKDKTLKQTVQAWADAKYNNLVRRGLDKGTVAGGISCGKLGQASKISYTGETRLKVEKGDDVETEEKVYLRGYIGSQYGNNQWNPLPDELEKEKRRLENRYSTKLEDYGTEAAFSLGKWNYVVSVLEGDSNDVWSELENVLMKIPKEKQRNQFLTASYSKDTLSLLEQVSQQREKVAGTYRIHNISETVSTIFTPYNTIGNVSEDGKLKADGVKDVANYSFSVANHKDEMPTEEDWDSCILAAEDIKKQNHINILDYKPGSYKQEGAEEDSLGEINDTTLCVLKNAYTFYLKQQDYEKFAKKAYCQVPDYLQKQLNTLIYDEGMNGEKDINKIINFVQFYLSENTNYTLSPGAVPSNKDFVSYFLFESQKGYCVYYASAATMLFRSMGVPARYVEGYVLDTNNTSASGNTKDGKIYTLTDKNAHAWVEIYQSGYGWVPVEVTKGRMTLQETEDGYDEDEEDNFPDDSENSMVPDATETPQPSAESGEQSSADEKIEDGQSTSTALNLRKIGHVVMPIVMVFLVLVLIYGKNRLQWYYREKKLERADYNEQTVLYYKSIMRILKLMKKCQKKEELREVIKKETFSVEQITREQFMEIVKIMNCYAYSESGVNAQQTATIKECYVTLRQEFYAHNNWIKRLYYQYILVV